MDKQIFLAIATCDRPEGLADLLTALRSLDVSQGLRFEVAVFDNSPDAGARGYVMDLAARYPWPLHFNHVPHRGLARVRNAALVAAEAAGATHLGFIDDDEVPVRNWLTAHLEALAATGAAASIGRVIPRYATPPPRWLLSGGFHAVRGAANLAPMPHGISGNTLMSLSPVHQGGLRFDPAYDQTGGEDTAFFAAYRAAGGALVYADAAVVEERVPPTRARLSWLLARWRRTGQTTARVVFAQNPRCARLVNCLGGGIARIGLGLVMTLGLGAMAPFGHPGWAKGLRIAARGAGFLDAAFGRYTAEYAKPR